MAFPQKDLRPWVQARWSCQMWWRWLQLWVLALHLTHPYPLLQEATTPLNMVTKVSFPALCTQVVTLEVSGSVSFVVQVCQCIFSETQKESKLYGCNCEILHQSFEIHLFRGKYILLRRLVLVIFIAMQSSLNQQALYVALYIHGLPQYTSLLIFSVRFPSVPLSFKWRLLVL